MTSIFHNMKLRVHYYCPPFYTMSNTEGIIDALRSPKYAIQSARLLTSVLQNVQYGV